MYFNFLPSINYDTKPVSYPFSESDFVVAKNFFRKYNISESAYSSAVYYNKVAIQDGQRLEQIAEAVYGNPFYDWVIALTNNMMNPLHDMPMSESELRNHVESTYDNPYYDTHHYEIVSKEKQEELFGKVILTPGTWVDQTFYEGLEKFEIDTLPATVGQTETLTIKTTKAMDELSYDPPIGTEPDFDLISNTSAFNTITAVDMLVYDFYQFEELANHPDYQDPRNRPIGWGFGQGGSASEVITVETHPQSFEAQQLIIYFGISTTPAPGDTLKIELVVPQGYFNIAVELDTIDLNFFDPNPQPESQYTAPVTYDIPENFRVSEGYLRFTYTPDGTGLRDQFIIAGWTTVLNFDRTYPLGYEVTQIDADNYIIDGTKWKRDGTEWGRQVRKGYAYNDDGVMKEASGNQLARPISVFEYEQYENEKKRELYILKPDLLETFVDEFRKASLYKKSSDYISNRLKKTGI